VAQKFAKDLAVGAGAGAPLRAACGRVRNPTRRRLGLGELLVPPAMAGHIELHRHRPWRWPLRVEPPRPSSPAPTADRLNFFRKNPTFLKNVATFCKMLKKIVDQTNISEKCWNISEKFWKQAKKMLVPKMLYQFVKC
jgi:hypothetical protein